MQAASSVPASVPLFETLLVFENQRQSVAFNAIDPRCTNFRLREKTNFPITLHGYADMLNFGFVGCRDALPHLQRLAVYTGDALDELEKLA